MADETPTQPISTDGNMSSQPIDTSRNHGYDRHDDGRLHKDMNGVSLALANLHGDLRDHTIEHMSAHTLYQGIGAITGGIASFVGLHRKQSTVKTESQKKIKVVFDVLKASSRDSDDHSKPQASNYETVDTSDLVKTFKERSGNHALEANKNGELSDTAETELKKYFDKHYKSALEPLLKPTPTEKAFPVFLRKLKDDINALYSEELNKAEPSAQDAIRTAKEKSVTFFSKMENYTANLNSAHTKVLDEIERHEHGILGNPLVTPLAWAASIVAGSYVGGAVHHFIDRKRKHKIDALSEEVQGLNRVMELHGMPTKDMNEIPAANFAERAKQKEALQRKEREEHLAAIREAETRIQVERQTKNKDEKPRADMLETSAPDNITVAPTPEGAPLPQVNALASLHHEGLAAAQQQHHMQHAGA